MSIEPAQVFPRPTLGNLFFRGAVNGNHIGTISAVLALSGIDLESPIESVQECYQRMQEFVASSSKEKIDSLINTFSTVGYSALTGSIIAACWNAAFPMKLDISLADSHSCPNRYVHALAKGAALGNTIGTMINIPVAPIIIMGGYSNRAAHPNEWENSFKLATSVAGGTTLLYSLLFGALNLSTLAAKDYRRYTQINPDAAALVEVPVTATSRALAGLQWGTHLGTALGIIALVCIAKKIVQHKQTSHNLVEPEAKDSIQTDSRLKNNIYKLAPVGPFVVAGALFGALFNIFLPVHNKSSLFFSNGAPTTYLRSAVNGLKNGNKAGAALAIFAATIVAAHQNSQGRSVNKKFYWGLIGSGAIGGGAVVSPAYILDKLYQDTLYQIAWNFF